MVHFVTWADYSGFSSLLGFQRAQDSGVLDLEHSDLQEPNVNLENICKPVDNHTGNLKLAKLGMFTPLELANVINQGLPSSLPLPRPGQLESTSTLIYV